MECITFGNLAFILFCYESEPNKFLANFPEPGANSVGNLRGFGLRMLFVLL